MENAHLPDQTMLVPMQTFPTDTDVHTAALDKLFVRVHDIQKLPNHFGESVANFEIIWSGFARVTGIGSEYAVEELAGTEIWGRNEEKVEM